MSRVPQVVVEVTLEGCALTYGVGACTAALGVTGSAKCYNTLATCQARAAMAANTTPLVLRFTDAAQPVPADYVALPLVTRVDFAPTRIDREAGLGPRETVKITLADTTHNDVGLDKYRSTRATPALQASTYWPRILARLPYWHRRPITVSHGFQDEPLSFVSRSYVVDRIDGPNAKGEVTITAKDVLALADDDKVQIPTATGWTLAAAITSGDTSATLAAGATGPTSGTLLVDDEAMTFTRSGLALTLTRGQLGTVADAHDAGAKIQVAYRIQGRIDAVLAALLTAAGVDPAWIPTAAWSAEADTWVPEAILDGWVVKPTGVRSLIKDLCAQTGSFIWWDALEQLVQLRFLRPGLSSESTDLTPDDHLLATGLALTRDEGRRLSEVWFYHGPRSFIDDATDSKAFGALAISANPEAADEEGLEWRAPRVLPIFGRYVPASSTLPQLLAGRQSMAYRDPPLRLTFQLDAKDRTVQVGGYVRVTLRGLVGADGTSRPRVFQVLECRPTKNGHAYEYLAEANGFDGRFAVQMADGSPDYVSPGLEPAGFQSNDFGTVNGEPPYLQS